MDEVVIVEYDSRWPMFFEQEAARIRQVLHPNLVVAIEHFGSTAVPGLAAKAIIDLLVGVHSLAQAQQAVVALETLGYCYWEEDPRSDRMFFVKGLPPNGPRTHHLHMVEPYGEFWQRLLFRDYLRQHSEEAHRYALLKRNLAHRFRKDREAYTEAKAEYVQFIMKKIQAQGKDIERKTGS